VYVYVYLVSARMVYMSTASNMEKCRTPTSVVGIRSNLNCVRKWLNNYTFNVHGSVHRNNILI